jgi:phospholipid/cholesterol/gamma-HCH transport system substrate-binding protein
LNVGTDVRLGGVVIGRIDRLTLKPRTYHVSIEMEIRSDVPIPQDSRLAVSGGTMSSPYLTINAGHSRQNVLPGGELMNR